MVSPISNLETVMKKKDIEIGAFYACKVSGSIVPVRITSESPHGGWLAVSEKTGREIRIRSAAKLRWKVSAESLARYRERAANAKRLAAHHKAREALDAACTERMMRLHNSRA